MQWSDYSALSISRAYHFVSAGLLGFLGAALTYLDTVYAILKQAGQPLRCEQISEQTPAQHLISPQGVTPEALIFRCNHLPASRVMKQTPGRRSVRLTSDVRSTSDGVDEIIEPVDGATDGIICLRSPTILRLGLRFWRRDRSCSSLWWI